MTTTSTRLAPRDRKAQILDAALEAATPVGIDRITFDAVAKRADVSIGLVIHYFGTMTKLRRTLMREAVKRGVVAIVARGLAVEDPQARKAPPVLRAQAAQYLAKQATA